MKMLSACLTTAVVLATAMNARSGDVQAGISISDGGVKGFYLAIGETYRVPEKEVMVIRERRIPDDELPVVFFIARLGRVNSSAVVEFRLGGKSWFEVARHFGVGPDAFYVEFRDEPAPPYGKAWGYYRKHPRSQWNRIVLADDDVINLVNLRFMTERYRCTPDEVVKLRASKKGFIAIHSEVEKKHSRGSEKKEVVGAKPAKGKHGKKHGDD
jgi:hypothetical protein